MNDLTDMVVLVTGGTSGIGKASAIRFAKAGARVILAGRNDERGNAVANEITLFGGIAEYVKLDLEDESSIEKLVSYISDRYGRLDALFNNAGEYNITPFRDIKRKKIGEFLDVHLAGTINLTQKCIDMLLESQGVILNNASICGLQDYNKDPNMVYAMEKAAIIKFTKILAKKYSIKLRCNALCPGTTKTAIMSEEFYDSRGHILPRGKVSSPEEVAAVANFLISRDASCITGAVIVVDGGESL